MWSLLYYKSQWEKNNMWHAFMTFYFSTLNWAASPELTVPVATLVLERKGAPRSSRISTTCSCPLLAPQWRGVSPSWKRRKRDDDKSQETKINQPYPFYKCFEPPDVKQIPWESIMWFVVLYKQNVKKCKSLKSQIWTNRHFRPSEQDVCIHWREWAHSL